MCIRIINAWKFIFGFDIISHFWRIVRIYFNAMWILLLGILFRNNFIPLHHNKPARTSYKCTKIHTHTHIFCSFTPLCGSWGFCAKIHIVGWHCIVMAKARIRIWWYANDIIFDSFRRFFGYPNGIGIGYPNEICIYQMARKGCVYLHSTITHIQFMYIHSHIHTLKICAKSGNWNILRRPYYHRTHKTRTSSDLPGLVLLFFVKHLFAFHKMPCNIYIFLCAHKELTWSHAKIYTRSILYMWGQCELRCDVEKCRMVVKMFEERAKVAVKCLCLLIDTRKIV